MEYDKERIAEIISDMERYLCDLEALNIMAAEQLSDRRNFYSSSMLLFSLINRTIDLGDELVSGNKLGIPINYGDIFAKLAKAKILPSELSDKLSKLVFYRNLFAHEYYDFTEKDVLKVMHKTGTLKEFLELAKKRVKLSTRP